MKKVIALVFAVALVAPAFALYDGNDSVTNAAFAVTYSTPSSVPCQIKYIIINSTAMAAASTLTLRDNTTTLITVTPVTTAGTQVFDLSNCKVVCGTNLNYVASVADPARVTIVYTPLLK